MMNREELYWVAPPGGEKIAINIDPYMVKDKPSGDGGAKRVC